MRWSVFCCFCLLFIATSTSKLIHSSNNVTVVSPPVCIMYVDSWNLPSLLSAMESSPSKVFIFAFLLVNSVSGPVKVEAFDAAASLTTDIVNKLHSAGKTVLLSFGGATMSWPQYKYLSSDANTDALARQLADFVSKLGADGIDLDYEDTAGLQGTAGYNGIDFLVSLTNKLRSYLPAGHNIITHAPQGPYVDPRITGYLVNPPYKPIMQRTNGAITWLNIQFYNNPGFQEPDYIPQLYKLTVGNYLTQQQAVLGKPVGPGDAGSGWFSITQLAQSVKQLVHAYPQMGGVMGWQFISDSTNGQPWQTAVVGAFRGFSNSTSQ